MLMAEHGAVCFFTVNRFCHKTFWDECQYRSSFLSSEFGCIYHK